MVFSVASHESVTKNSNGGPKAAVAFAFEANAVIINAELIGRSGFGNNLLLGGRHKRVHLLANSLFIKIDAIPRQIA